MHLKSELIKGVASFEKENLVVFYYLSASEIWPDKGGSLWCEWPYKRETTVLKHLRPPDGCKQHVAIFTLNWITDETLINNCIVF